jgi:[histone H3]-lysine36 N-trimethyltransferase
MDWATAITRKRRRAKKDDDEDDDYIVGPQTRPVTEDGVARIMSALLQAREKWVITKLLTRLQVVKFYSRLIGS